MSAELTESLFGMIESAVPSEPRESLLSPSPYGFGVSYLEVTTSSLTTSSQRIESGTIALAAFQISSGMYECRGHCCRASNRRVRRWVGGALSCCWEVDVSVLVEHNGFS